MISALYGSVSGGCLVLLAEWNVLIRRNFNDLCMHLCAHPLGWWMDSGEEEFKSCNKEGNLPNKISKNHILQDDNQLGYHSSRKNISVVQVASAKLRFLASQSDKRM